VERVSEAELEVRCVEWIDSAGGTRWMQLSEIVGNGPDRCFSVGYVLRETDDQLTLLQSLAPHDDHQDYGQSGDNYIVIPKFAITKSRTLRKAKA
jgi:hypothetical protein